MGAIITPSERWSRPGGITTQDVSNVTATSIKTDILFILPPQLMFFPCRKDHHELLALFRHAADDFQTFHHGVIQLGAIGGVEVAFLQGQDYSKW